MHSRVTNGSFVRDVESILQGDPKTKLQVIYLINKQMNVYLIL